MEQVSLRAHTGRATGSRQSRRLRRSGAVPAIVYGREVDPISVAVDARELHNALHTELGTNAVINLLLDGGEEILTLARVVDRHPFRNEYRHIDFVKVSLTETVTTEVGIHFEGEPIGVIEGGVFSPRRTSVQIEALVTQIPGFIELDVSGVEVGSSLRIEDLPVMEGVTYLEDLDAVVMSVTLPALEIEEPVEEPLEGEEAAAVAEGDEEGEASDAEDQADGDGDSD